MSEAGDAEKRETAAGIPDHHDPVELAERVNELTPGETLPHYLEWDGDTITTPKTAGEDICQLIRELRDDMKSVEIATALDYGRSMVSFHIRGECRHWTPTETVNLQSTSRAPNEMEVTDTEKVVSLQGRQYYHAYSDGRPACGQTGSGYKIWEDLDMARTWKKPCGWCFPERSNDE